MHLFVNGSSYEVGVDPESMLLGVLRHDLGLTGTKYGCGEGVCGACTVLVDGEAARSCITPVVSVVGRQLTTFEGLATEDKLHPVQAAFVEHTAFQCAFCSPGFIMSTVALLSRQPRPNGGQVRAALSGHICRCGTYPRILRAVQAAGEHLLDDRPVATMLPSSEHVALVVTGYPQAEEQRAPEALDSPEATLLTMDRLGLVTALSGKVEYGQGIRTGFRIEVADELDVPVSAVSVVLGDTDAVPHDGGTTGSASTRTVGLQLRRAAATARQSLIELAAERLAAPPEGLAARDGRVHRVDDPGRTVSYSELLKEQDISVRVADDVGIKAPEGFAVMGRPARRADAVGRVTGEAKYSRDIAVSGMLHGRVLRPPSYGAALQQLDSSRAERVPGFVSLVQEDGFVAVVAEREDTAEYALDALRVRWQEDRSSIADWNLPAHLKEKAPDPEVVREDRSLSAGFEEADHVLERVYFLPYVANAAMEPSAAVASWDGDYLTAWCGNRSPFKVRDQLAEALGVSGDKVRVVVPEIGGAFGTKATDLAAVEAARLAKAVGRPVRVAYSRSEEFAWGTVRPAGLIEIRSGTRADGAIVAWDHSAIYAGGGTGRGQRGADTPYDTPNVRIAVADAESPLKSGSYRSLGGAINHFAREVHMDEIAATVGLDPVELRLRNLTDPRFRRVLNEAVDRFGWESRRSGTSSGFGVALGYDVGSYVAECVELTAAGRELKVERVVAAFDCGLVVNPDGVRNQVEGSIMMGIGTALWESVEFDGGRVLNPTFSGYRVPRITDAPEIEVALVGDPTAPSTGAGEPAIVPIAAAIANAVYDATGSRIPELPIVPHLT